MALNSVRFCVDADASSDLGVAVMPPAPHETVCRHVIVACHASLVDVLGGY